MKRFSHLNILLSLLLFVPVFSTGASDIEEEEADTKEKFYVYPDKTKYVVISNHDINRIHCSQGYISGIWHAKNKGLTVTLSDTDAILTYDIRYDTEKNRSQYVTKEHSLHFKCGGSYYQLKAKPSDTDTKIIYARSDVKKVPKRAKKTRDISDKEMMSLMFKKAENGAYRKTEKIMVSELKLNGADLTLKHFISSYDGDFVIDMYSITTSHSIEVKQQDFNLASFRKDIVAINVSSNIIRSDKGILLTLISRRVKN